VVTLGLLLDHVLDAIQCNLLQSELASLRSSSSKTVLEKVGSMLSQLCSPHAAELPPAASCVWALIAHGVGESDGLLGILFSFISKSPAMKDYFFREQTFSRFVAAVDSLGWTNVALFSYISNFPPVPPPSGLSHSLGFFGENG
jgi:hypothetical protein